MGANHGRQFHVHMFEEDIQMMKELVKLHPEKETGGNLFGLWNNDEEPVLHVVLGPAIGCTRTEVSFYQSIPYLERVGRLLTERFLLCHIGEWHSHHKLRLSEPSSGDSSTVIRNFPRGARGFILIIANILPSGVVELSPYLYRQGQTTYEKGLIRRLGSPCSPFRKIDVIKENIERDVDRKRFGRIPSTQQQPVNYNNRRQDDSVQERLEFDKDTGKLVVCRNPQAPQAASVHESAVAVLEVRAPVPDRPVVDAMAAQGFFYLKMMNVF
ncbi:unnamed protein product [Pocillopora meandrina]|uniref:Uncharacterized protein n=1 Tax=Pocillopora meandrina TaxID=46732 RepID=A0AAU9WE34_9CNID|nr:unnamed protein product [Pocillopora meandrina]